MLVSRENQNKYNFLLITFPIRNRKIRNSLTSIKKKNEKLLKMKYIYIYRERERERETKLFVSREKKNSNQNKYHSSNYISETKIKPSDETHSLQLNQYLFLKNCLLKRQIHRNLIVSREKKSRSREREREGRLTRWWKWEAWE